MKLGLKLIKTQFPDLEFDPAMLLDDQLLEKKNIAEVIRVFSFYAMKERAGEVGSKDARLTLCRLQARYPEAQRSNISAVSRLPSEYSPRASKRSVAFLTGTNTLNPL